MPYGPGASPLDRPTDNMARMVRLLDQQVSASKLTQSSDVTSLQADWDRLHSEYPKEFESSNLQKMLWYEAQGTDCWNRRDVPAALVQFEQQAKHGVRNHYNFGQVLCESGQFDRGAERFAKSIEANPGNVESFHHLGLHLRHRKSRRLP